MLAGPAVANWFHVLLQITDDMNSIGWAINSALNYPELVAALASPLSNLREAGALIKGIEGAASGVLPVMKLFGRPLFP